MMNIITGLCRRSDYHTKFKNTKIGILPFGKTNKIWNEFSKTRESTWERPWTRSNRITDAAKVIGEV